LRTSDLPRGDPKLSNTDDFCPTGTKIDKGFVMPETLSAFGLSFWSDVTLGTLLAVTLIRHS
jgi:hypothetical protein